MIDVSLLREGSVWLASRRLLRASWLDMLILWLAALDSEKLFKKTVFSQIDIVKKM